MIPSAELMHSFFSLSPQEQSLIRPFLVAAFALLKRLTNKIYAIMIIKIIIVKIAYSLSVLGYQYNRFSKIDNGLECLQFLEFSK